MNYILVPLAAIGTGAVCAIISLFIYFRFIYKPDPEEEEFPDDY